LKKTILLLDERNVDHAFRLKREVHKPENYIDDPIMIPGVAYGSVLRDKEGLYRMWYLNMIYVDGKKKGQLPWEFNNVYCECYAESIDGINWVKPELNMVSIDLKESQQLPDNAFMSACQDDEDGNELCGGTGPEGFCVIDNETTPHPCARSRFTAMYITEFSRINKKGICFAQSEDGIRWKAYPENPLIEHWPDANNCFFYDEQKKKYVLYSRPNVYTKIGTHANRLNAYTESDDLIHWSPYKVILDTDDRDADPFDFKDEGECRNHVRSDFFGVNNYKKSGYCLRGRDRQFYGFQVFPYNGIYVGFTEILDVITGVAWLELVHSYDGVDWRREAMPIDYIGPRPGKWDSIRVHPCMASPPIIQDEDIWIYYSGSSVSHNIGKALNRRGIGIKIFKKDRFVGYAAIDYDAELVTIPVKCPKRISLNISNNKGKAMVELIGPNGEKIKGFEKSRNVIGDGIAVPVKYETADTLDSIDLASVRMRIELKNAVLYSIILEY
jgi:hypothetical protein